MSALNVGSSSPQCNISVQIWVSLQQFSSCWILVDYRAGDTEFERNWGHHLSESSDGNRVGHDTMQFCR